MAPRVIHNAGAVDTDGGGAGSRGREGQGDPHPPSIDFRGCDVIHRLAVMNGAVALRNPQENTGAGDRNVPTLRWAH